jgi:biotin carboxylase
VKLLALEASQNSFYYLSRYRQIVDLGVELFVLNGVGTDDHWRPDRYRIAGGTHVDDLVRAARDWHEVEHFDGVLTFSESAVVLVAAVADALGLPGIGVPAAVASRNKLIMRQAHERGGAPHPSFRFTPTVEDAVAAAGDFGYPVILKPTLGAASNFVFRIDDEGQLRERYAQAAAGIGRMSWYRMEAGGVELGPHGLLVESFLDGHEHLIEAVVWDGEVFLGSIVDRITVEGDTFDDDVHHTPTALTPDQVDAVRAAVEAGARSQGLHRSVLHAEVRFHGDEPFLLEIAVRPGGGGLDHMARHSGGHDPIRAVVDVAAGRRPDVHHYRPTGVHTAGMCLISAPGEIAAIDVPPEVSESENVIFMKIMAQPGDVIRRPPHGNDILGGFCVTGVSLDDAMRVATDLAGKIAIRIEDPR